MARWQPRREQRTQIDPFNAPDPVMPGDDAVVMEPDAHAGHASHKTFETKARPTGPRAPSADAGPSPAPAPKRPLARQRGRKADKDDPTSPWARKASRAALRMVAIVFAVIVVVNVVSIGSALVSSLFDAWTSDANDYDYYEDYYDDYDFEAASYAEGVMEDEVSSRVEAELRAYVNADDAAVASASESISLEIEDWTGLDPATLGVDATELARWALANSSYEMSDAYASAEPSEGGHLIEGDVYYYVTVPDLYTVISGISSLCYNELYDARYRGALTPDERDLVARRLESLRSAALDEPLELYCSVDYRGFVSEGGEVESVTLEGDPLEDLPL